MTTFQSRLERPIEQFDGERWLKSMINCIACNNLRWWCRGCSDENRLEQKSSVLGFNDDRIRRRIIDYQRGECMKDYAPLSLQS